MSARAQADGWHPNLVRGRCVECDWSGPVHDVYMPTGPVVVKLEIQEHNEEHHPGES